MSPSANLPPDAESRLQMLEQVVGRKQDAERGETDWKSKASEKK